MLKCFNVVLSSIIVLGPLAASAAADDIRVILCEIPTDARSIVPGARDLAGNPLVTHFKALEDLQLNLDGTQWFLKARSQAGSDLETLLLLGSSTTAEMFAQEGQPVQGGAAGELYEFFDGAAGFNSAGHLAYGARVRNGDPTTKEKVVVYDGVTHNIVVQESDAALGLQDLPPNPSGDELFGNSLNSIHLLDDGRVGFVAATIQNIHSFRRPAIFYGNTAFAQSGVTPIGGGIWDSFDSNDFGTTPDGTTWFAQGDDEGDPAIDDILVVNGQVELREGALIPGSSVTVAAVFATRLTTNGDWLSRGDDPNDDDWAVRNGVLLAKTGDEIGATGEHLGNVFLALAGNQNGDWLLIANTDNADPSRDTVMLLNGEVVMREGDPIDLDENGQFDDDVFIGRGNNTSSAFAPNDLFLSDDLTLFFIAPLRDSAGNDLGSNPAFGSGGEALMTVRLGAACDPCDMNCDGLVDANDIEFFIDILFNGAIPCDPCTGDTNGDGMVDAGDIEGFINCLFP